MLCYYLLPKRFIVTINVLWLFLTVPCVGLQCVIVVFLDHIMIFALKGCFFKAKNIIGPTEIKTKYQNIII